MTNALKIAEYFLSLSNPEIGDSLTNLKLQKLLYYAQGFHIVLLGDKLFEEEIIAWEYGPVVKEVYDEFKEHGSAGIEVPEEIDFSDLTDKQKELLNEVYEVYGQFSAFKLMEMTHSESPWNETGRNEVISTDKLKLFFPTLVNEDE